ncbi:MAG: anti-sigma factor family protein [Candidatus Cyclobacteriaceae bacterium M2_1C_046]
MNLRNIKEEQLIAFLYGEVSAEERKEVEEFLKANPDKQRELEEMGAVRSIMAKYADEEQVSIPKINYREEPKSYHLFRYWSVAASVLLLLTFGWIGYNSISSRSDSTGSVTLTNEQLNDLIQQQQQLSSANKALVQKINDLQLTIEELDQDQQEQMSMINTLNKENLSGEQQVQNYFASLQDENKRLINEYFMVAESSQKQYLELVLSDFAGYINEQREQDLMVIQSRIINLEQNQGEVKYATEQLLANLTNSEIHYQNQ